MPEAKELSNIVDHALHDHLADETRLADDRYRSCLQSRSGRRLYTGA